MTINILIFIAGLAIYAGYGLSGLCYILAATVLTYAAGLIIKKYRWVMWLSVGLNVIMLVAVKLQAAVGYSFIAPLGMSYFTLQLISYNVDIYKGKYEPERNLFRYALFVTYIPHLFVGPIEHYDIMRPALFEKRKITWDGIFDGGARAVWGLFKKLVIASRAGVIVSSVATDVQQYNGAFALLAMLMYSIQLYADFSGGIDMVLGVSKMLGISISENFDSPYFSQSFQEFWRRWHITLGAWLREYVYIPLGGNRKGKVRKVMNLIITFLASGLWHGVNYLLWGLFNGIFVSVGERLKTKSKVLNCTVTFLLITLLWSFFVWSDAFTALKMTASVFTTFNYGALIANIGNLGLELGEWMVLIVSTALLWGYDLFRDRIHNGFKALCPWKKTAVICTVGIVVLIFGMYGIGFNAEEFIYSRF